MAVITTPNGTMNALSIADIKELLAQYVSADAADALESFVADAIAERENAWDEEFDEEMQSQAEYYQSELHEIWNLSREAQELLSADRLNRIKLSGTINGIAQKCRSIL